MAEGINYDEDLAELDRIWPLGKQLIVPDGGSVLVAGAYEGRYMDYICTRFKPGKVLGFEPQLEKAILAEDRLRQHGQIAKMYGLGIGVQDCKAFVEDYGTDGCRVSRAGPFLREVKLRSIESILDEHGPFDLFICNMEGYEIPLLSYLYATGRISEIKSLAVQFHTVTPQNWSSRNGVPAMLQEYYGDPVYDDGPTWSCWGATRPSAGTDTIYPQAVPTLRSETVRRSRASQRGSGIAPRSSGSAGDTKDLQDPADS